MSAKQDRQYPRTAVDLERKLDFERKMRLVNQNIEKTAKSVTELDKSLDHDEIFKRLTNDGAIEGIYRDAGGNVYVNASYIKGGLMDTSLLDVDEIFAQEINAEQVNIISGTESGGFNAASSEGNGGFQMSYAGNSREGYYTSWNAPGSALDISAFGGISINPGSAHPSGDGEIILNGETAINGDTTIDGDLTVCLTNYSVASDEDVDSILVGVINGMGDQTFKRIVLSFTTTNNFTGSGGHYYVDIYKLSANYAMITAKSYIDKGRTIQRIWYAGELNPWEWVNPPMVLDVEYRTTERHNGKVVYKKKINFGALPSTAEKSVSAMPAGSSLVEAIGYASGTSYNVPIPGYYFIKSMGSTRSTGSLWISTSADGSAYNAYIALKYTKPEG